MKKQHRSKFRVGNGIDFHKLIHNPDRPLKLGGVIIPSEFSLLGHSDADIVLHSLADAILGALALGDIGEYFPDTDPKWKNMDSVQILDQVLGLLEEKSYHLGNVDITIVAEKPKITPFKKEIRENLSGLMSLPVENISIKATTMEGMGALGRAEGMMVFTSLLLEER
jgi:2-C-methyl-D-erythritol 2,4-cyclodiphosphate synthase